MMDGLEKCFSIVGNILLNRFCLHENLVNLERTYIHGARPYRLIQLCTFEREVVLDPFMGSGQATIAAIKTKRHYVGYDIDEEYVKLAERHIRAFVVNFKHQKSFDF